MRQVEKDQIARVLERVSARLRAGEDIELTYISTTPDGVDAHCRECAIETAKGWLEPNGEEWHPEVEQVSWGVYVPIERAAQRDLVETPDGEWDYECDYVLTEGEGES